MHGEKLMFSHYEITLDSNFKLCITKRAKGHFKALLRSKNASSLGVMFKNTVQARLQNKI
jgi:hypothetical protein